PRAGVTGAAELVTWPLPAMPSVPASPDRIALLSCRGSMSVVTGPGPHGSLTGTPQPTYVTRHVMVNMTCHVIVDREGSDEPGRLSRLPGPGHAEARWRRARQARLPTAAEIAAG